MSATDDLLRQNLYYTWTYRAHAPKEPVKRVAIVTCMDARIDAFKVLGLNPGDAHVIRNAGGVLTDDVLRSLLISQRLLGTREVMLIHHTECGMLNLSEEQLAAQVEADAAARPAFPLGAFANVEQDVREMVASLRSSPFLVHRNAIRGFVYDVTTGRLSEVLGPPDTR